MTQHSAIGPSALSRLLACPASHKLSVGKKRASSAYAAEGSVAHEIVEFELSDDQVLDESHSLGDVVSYEGHEITVDQDMIDGAHEMVAFCRILKEGADKVWTEKQVDLAPLWDGEPPEPIFGTVDFGAYTKATDTLYVVDFKYGRLPVSPNDNPQAYAYALGACYELGRFPAHVVLVIIQPRGQDGQTIKASHISGLDLKIWAEETLKPGVDALFGSAPVFSTGDHCRFCAAKINCPALYQQAKDISRTEFDALPPDPISLDDGELSKILDSVEDMTMWFDEIRAEASGRIEKGKTVPGWKLVPKRAIRKWDNIKVVEDFLQDNQELWDRKLKSPTQVEKVDPEVYQEAMERGYVSQQSSGTTLAPDHDPRTAVKGRSGREDFDVIE